VVIGLFRSRASLEAEILTLRHQLNVLRRKAPKRLAFNGFITAVRTCGSSGGSLAKGMTKISYSDYRFPPDILQQAIWLYLRFTLSLAQQSSGELASADPTTRAQNARFQERRVSAKISLSACSSPQHIQRPTSSYIGKNAPSLQDIGDADMARSRRCGVSPTCQQNCYVLSSIM
jgi:hypothetical protein